MIKTVLTCLTMSVVCLCLFILGSAWLGYKANTANIDKNYLDVVQRHALNVLAYLGIVLGFLGAILGAVLALTLPMKDKL